MRNKSYYLLLALEQAQQGLGQCAPNPAVGAVVVRNGRIIAHGYHHGPGLPHAEVEALQHLEYASDCELYVTLEPCCHRGRTPPCTDLIIAKQLKKVYFGYLDPNPVVAGQGQWLLQRAGIECEHLALAEVDSFYRSYHYWWQHQLPWVTTKLAISDRHEVAIGTLTNSACQQYTHEQRLQHDALLTTVATIIYDDPLYNARLVDATVKKPLYILDREARLPLTARILESCAPVVIFYHQASASRIAALNEAGVECRQTSLDGSQLDPNNFLASIGADGRHSLWVEAGPTCFMSFLKQGFANEILLYIAAHNADVKTRAFEFSYERGHERDIEFAHIDDNLLVKIS